MQEFKIEGEAPIREARVRWLSWGIVLLLFALSMAIFILHYWGLVESQAAGVVAIICLLAGFCGACLVGIRTTLSLAFRQMIFVLDDNAIIRRRKGYSDIRIPYSELSYVGEELGTLIVKSSQPYRKIAIPNRVFGYETICAELSKHHALSPQSKFPWKSAAKSAALTGISVLSWGVVLSSRDRRLVVPAGVIALTTFTMGIHYLWTLFRRGWATKSAQ
jgi:hypothetical protein